MTTTDMPSDCVTDRPRDLDDAVLRKLTRMATQFPECTPMLKRVQQVMAMENPTWNEQHAAAMYARLLEIMLTAMSVLKGESSSPPVITGWESLVDEFFTIRIGTSSAHGAEAA